MAFVKWRQITDSLVFVEEIINKWKREKIWGLVVKLDFENAYDSVDYGFLDATIEGMGFGSKWRWWISDCISSPLLSVLDNESLTSQFDMEKGLRQDHLLSSSLFNIVIGGLRCLLQRADELCLVMGEDFDNSVVHISHLHFADDTIFFIKPKLEFILNTKRILRCFELASGLKINCHKSCIARVCHKEQKKNGLGIGRVAIKNKGMLAKWVWRFGKEDTFLWKRVIVVRYGLDRNCMYCNLQDSTSPSFFVKVVASLFKPDSRFTKVLDVGMKVIIGDGAKASFLRDS
ncbi:hypothetical protein Dsin_004898 [Dipteronia sinensis]|uniref:Reverse transcriptase domain-containing protein n=1 Tax=Dipteronia sinensis TaxID=43782 RepID=A0AAE0EE67_9ROSI|nr:hypothetical protein Dsin_004898 [Dipteronia sinensis]